MTLIHKNFALDVFIPSKNRHKTVYSLLKRLCRYKLKGIRILIVDDGSDAIKKEESFPFSTYRQIFDSFDHPSFELVTLSEGVGLADVWCMYYNGGLGPISRYVVNPTDKDIFISIEPIKKSIKLMDQEMDINLVTFGCRVTSRHETNQYLPTQDIITSGKLFLEEYFLDTNLQRCSPYSMKRNDIILKRGGLRNYNLNKFGLIDAFGIDMEQFLNVAISGRVARIDKPYIKIITKMGATERFPLCFAYCYYQYIKRVLLEFERSKKVDKSKINLFIKFWHLLIIRGFYTSLNHVHSTELEVGRSKIGSKLKIPVHLYLLKEKIFWRIGFSSEERKLFMKTLRFFYK